MSKAIVASLRGSWIDVVNAVNFVFAENEFTLIAEEGFRKEQLHLRKATVLNSANKMISGRAFNKSCEMRWRKISTNKFIITFLSETKQPPTGFATVNGDWQKQDGQQKLYGKWSDHLEDWVEVAVSGVSYRYQSLGVNQSDESLKIAVVHYLKDGCVQMTRFCEISKYDKSQ